MDFCIARTARARTRAACRWLYASRAGAVLLLTMTAGCLDGVIDLDFPNAAPEQLVINDDARATHQVLVLSDAVVESAGSGQSLLVISTSQASELSPTRTIEASADQQARAQVRIATHLVDRSAGAMKPDERLSDRLDEELVHVAEADVNDDGELDLVGITAGGRLMAWFSADGRFHRYDNQLLFSGIRGRVCGFVVGEFNFHKGIDFAIAVIGLSDSGGEGRHLVFALSSRESAKDERHYEPRSVFAPSRLPGRAPAADARCMDMITAFDPAADQKDVVITMDGQRYGIPEGSSRSDVRVGEAWPVPAYHRRLSRTVGHGRMLALAEQGQGMHGSGRAPVERAIALFWDDTGRRVEDGQLRELLVVHDNLQRGGPRHARVHDLRGKGDSAPRAIAYGGPESAEEPAIWVGRTDGSLSAYGWQATTEAATTRFDERWHRTWDFASPGLTGVGDLVGLSFADLDDNGYLDALRVFESGDRISVLFFRDPAACLEGQSC